MRSLSLRKIKNPSSKNRNSKEYYINTHVVYQLTFSNKWVIMTTIY